MSYIRLRFAGIVGFLSQILSLFTGLIFTTIITRNLSVIEFGQWNTISSLIYYGAFSSNLLAYWYTRYTARNISIARTGILITIIFAIGGIIPFLIAAKLFVAEYEKLFYVILFTSLQVLITSVVYNLAAIANGKRPEIATYGFLVFEIAKVIVAFLVVFSKGLTLMDAIAIIIIAEFIRAIILAVLIRDELRKKVEKENILRIIKSIWIPFYNRISGLIYTTDVLIVSLLTLSYTHIAMFKVGLVFSTIVQFGSQLAFPLYIKLLGGGKAQDVETTAKLMFTFMIPLAAGIFVLAKPLLYLLNPEYASSEIILQLLVLYSFSLAINDFLYNVIQGNEKIDTMTTKFRDLLHSTLFTLPTLNLIRTGAYISGLVIFIMLTSSHNMPSKTFGETWAIILMVTNIPITVYLSNIVKRKIPFRVPWRNIGKYVLSATVMTIMMLYFMKFLTYNQKTTLFATEIFGIISASMAIYFGILLMIDVETRRLLKDGFALVRK